MKKSKITINIGMLLPWICIVLFTMANGYYVENLIHRSGLQFLIVLNACIMFRLARKCKKLEEKEL